MYLFIKKNKAFFHVGVVEGEESNLRNHTQWVFQPCIDVLLALVAGVGGRVRRRF